MAQRRPPRNNRRESNNKQDWVINYLLIVSSVVWVANFVLGIFLDAYEGSETINAVFIAVIGGIFTLRGQRKNGD